MVSLLGGGRAPHATSDGPGLHEAFLVWAVWGVVGVGVWVTYARLPVDELYNVSGTGFAAGAGVLDPNELDARAANVPAALGVLLALLLTLAAACVRGVGVQSPPTRGDRLALAAAPVVVLLSVRWILAGVGVQVSGAVHLGNHEGIDGVLLAGTAFALRRPLRWMRRTPLRPLLGGYLAVLAIYGMAVAADDFWIEQLQRRGAVSHGLPYVLKPGPRPAWAALLAVACVAYAVAFRVRNESGSATARR